jgi:seryl-tRNA synthetase
VSGILACPLVRTSVLLADLLIVQYETEQARKEVNTVQKDIGKLRKNKEDATQLMAEKTKLDQKIADLTAKTVELAKSLDKKASTIGNIVDPACYVSATEVSSAAPCEIPSAYNADIQDDNPRMKLWHPEPNHKGNSIELQLEDKTEGIISHHEVLARLEAFDTERGGLTIRTSSESNY